MRHWRAYLVICGGFALFMYFAMAYEIDFKPRQPLAMARCKDQTLSYSQHRSGTCSRHGGVDEWLRDRS